MTAVSAQECKCVVSCTSNHAADVNTYSDIQQEHEHAAEQGADVLWKLAHHARRLFPGLTQTHQELRS